MRIRRVRAHAFGPLIDQELDLAPGMTVVVGANEAGKSSWHAAIYAALCGMRRGRGAATKDDRAFADRHRPWHDPRWEVSCVVELPDGRTVELHHDLAGRVDSSAIDLALGTDVSREIIRDGAPDGSAWLGLDRRAFLGVSCVRQADILAVTDHASALQEHLQRAAATAGTDETAAAALQALDAYRREHVGQERRNSTKPLMAAITAVEQAEAAHQAALVAHDEWLRRVELVARLEANARKADQTLRAAEAAMAHRQLAELRQRIDRIAQLQRRYPEPPKSPSDDEELASRVTGAIHGWVQRPLAAPLEGPSAAEIEARLAALPEPPEGDLEPDPAVVELHRALVAAEGRLDAHRQAEPVPVEVPDTGGLSEGQVLDLARELDTEVPDVDPALVEQVERLRREAEAPVARRGRTAVVVLCLLAVVGVVAGGVLLATGATAAGAGGVGAAVLATVAALVVGLRRRTPPVDTTELRAAETRLVTAEQLAAAAEARRNQAVERAASVGLPADAAALRGLADQLRRVADTERARQQWAEAEQRLVAAVDSAIDSLCLALDGRGVEVPDGADAEKASFLVALYEQQCRERRAQAQAAAERPGLLRELDVRRRAEQRLAEDEAAVRAARAELFAVAVPCGVSGVDGVTEDQLVDQLRAWLEARVQNRTAFERARDEWRELQLLLDGGTLDELQERAAELDARRATLEAGLPAELVGTLDLGVDAGATIARLRDEARRLAGGLAEAKGDLAARAERVVPVAETEEALAAARAELERVRRLERTLQLTEGFMRNAQEAVHRDIAPVLAATLQARLGRVTGGRYTEAIVDPQTLQVQVRGPGGTWRPADHLSHGTAEQVYLLLRVAMSEILTDAEPPLLLDDVTVQSDPVRTLALLDVLHQVSADHQVVLFSQESEVKDWAKSHLELAGGRDSLVLLPPLRAAG
jgi:exonuclease SbcC